MGISYLIKKRVSWVLSNQETVQGEDGFSVRSDPGNLDLKYIYPSSEWTFSTDECLDVGQYLNVSDGIIPVKRRAGDKSRWRIWLSCRTLNGREQNRAAKLDNCQSNFFNEGFPSYAELKYYIVHCSYVKWLTVCWLMPRTEHLRVSFLPLTTVYGPGLAVKLMKWGGPESEICRGFNCCSWKLIWQNRDVILMSHRFRC